MCIVLSVAYLNNFAVYPKHTTSSIKHQAQKS